MEVLALSLVKSLAGMCLKYYMGFLIGSGAIQGNRNEMGYKIPRWYMNPGRQATAFYAYGTSVEGDEFESLEQARREAVAQMVDLIRRSHRKIIRDEIRYDSTSIKQQRLVELFTRGEQLDAFVLDHAVVDKKAIVKVKHPSPDLRAFVRIRLNADDYLSNQEETLRDLRTRLTQQKTEDILAELDAELRADAAPVPPDAAPVPTDTVPVPTDAAPPPTALTPPPPPAPSSSPADAVFDELQSELEDMR